MLIKSEIQVCLPTFFCCCESYIFLLEVCDKLAEENKEATRQATFLLDVFFSPLLC